MGEARADLISLALFFADDRGMNSAESAASDL
jgi:hypothetical protein